VKNPAKKFKIFCLGADTPQELLKIICVPHANEVVEMFQAMPALFQYFWTVWIDHLSASGTIITPRSAAG